MECRYGSYSISIADGQLGFLRILDQAVNLRMFAQKAIPKRHRVGAGARTRFQALRKTADPQVEHTAILLAAHGRRSNPGLFCCHDSSPHKLDNIEYLRRRQF